MQSSVETRKKTRSRSKSIGLNSSTKLNEVNLNGEKSEDIMDVDTTETGNSKGVAKSNAADFSAKNGKEEKTLRGRKRKASEMKLNDTTSDEPPAKDKPSAEAETTDDVTPDVSILSVSDEHGDDFHKEDNLNQSESKDFSALNDSSELPLPDRGSLGKGKRARIPNKRYSDFPLRTPTKLSLNDNELHSGIENGETKENLDSGSNTDASETSVSVTGSPILPPLKPMKTYLSASPAASAQKKKSIINLANPNYLKPFQYGWKRELVYRATIDATLGKRNGDIYYYTPNGRKVRSMREVSENLKTKELTLDDFTFTKEPLGLEDPEKEIIRDAKNKSASGTPLIKKLAAKIPKTPKLGSPKTVSTPSSPQENEKDIKPKDKEPKAKNSPRVGGFKIKLAKGGSGKGKAEKKSKDSTSDELELGTYPPNWTPTKKTNKAGKSASAKKPKRNTRASAVADFTPPETQATTSYLQNVAYGYSTLLYVFQYLKVQDLLRASCVCSMWRDIAGHPVLWRTVRMKNSQIHSFEGLAHALQKHGTVHLDLRKMLLPNSNGTDDIWQEFSREIKKVESLKKIELCRCPATVVEQLALSNPKLEVINAVTIKCEGMSLAPLVFLKDLKELRLKSTAGFSLTSDLTALSDLKELTHLSLTSIKDLNKLNINVIADLKNLESLDLGECADFPKTFGSEILTRLNKLEKLRLEKGQGNCYTFELLDAVKNMPHLEQLELVNFDIKTGFDKALGACTNIKKLLIIPTYISQSATTNHMVLGGVLRLQSNLSHFVWGITLELLRVTELFVDQCEDVDKKDKKEKKPMGNGDSIPVLKPVPLLKEGASLNIPPAQDPPQVEILPLPNLQKLLLQSLPTTRVKILKIPFHATWRQSITDTVN